MKLSLGMIFEIARWKSEGQASEGSDVLSFLKSISNRGYFLTFTNTPQKIGFNPSGKSIGNPVGYYGFPIVPEAFEYITGPGALGFGHRSHIVVWKPKSGLNIIKWKDVPWSDNIKRNGAGLTKELLKLGYDGLFSSKVDGQMSGDMFSEIVIFKSSNVEVFKIFPNTIAQDFAANNAETQMNFNRNFDTDEVPGWAAKRYGEEVKYYQRQNRNIRKGLNK